MAKNTGRGASSDAPASAAHFVRRGAEAIQSRDAHTPRRRAEYLALIEWARCGGRLIESNFLERFAYKGSGAEHRVYYDVVENGAIKVTHPNGFGHSAFGPGYQATPVEYLKRLGWCNRLLGDSFRVLGVIYDGEQLQVVSAQPWISAHEIRPHPESSEIDDYFKHFGFVRASENPDVPLYCTPDVGLLVADAHDHNVIRDREGKLAAIDVVIGSPGPELKRNIKALLADVP
jgi:hypothetical protein